MLDGMADALEINDCQCEPMTFRREYGKKPGGVSIEISGATVAGTNGMDEGQLPVGCALGSSNLG